MRLPQHILRNRLLASAAVLFTLALGGDIHIAAAAATSGEQIFVDQCARCHGKSGEGTADNYPDPLAGDKSVPQLTKLIHETMPEDAEEKCSEEDAAKVAAYIYDAFYSVDARVRNKPARVELSRLTVRQYQNAVADLIETGGPDSLKALKRATEELNQATQAFAARRMDATIRRALAGHRVDEIA